MIPIQHTVFTPALAGSNNEGTNLKTGTTTLGLICKDCVILAADRRATAGGMIANKNTEKVRTVTRHIGVTIAGNVSDLQLLYKYLVAELRLKEMRGGREATVKEAANLLSAWVYNLIRSSYGITHFLVGGYDTKPQLFDVYPDGSSMDINDYVTSGSGSVFAMGVLENKYKAGLSKDDGVKLAIEAMAAALARDSGSGNGVDVYVFTKDGGDHVVAKSIEPKI